jgi:uncharacterized protein (TIGR02145 family)
MTTLKISFSLIIGLFVFSACEKHKESGLPVDGDGNEYDTVVIGTQVWLGENLKTTKYNNGVSIPLVTDNSQWASMSSAAFCWYGNNRAAVEQYGALYNWWAVKVSFLCPIGYHVPSKEEWSSLIDYLGGEEIAGAKLKATGNQFWINNNSQTTNESGFTAMPGGRRSPNDGTFDSMRGSGSWWTSSPGIDDDSGRRVDILSGLNGAYIMGLSKKAGFSVRCIKTIDQQQ